MQLERTEPLFLLNRSFLQWKEYGTDCIENIAQTT